MRLPHDGGLARVYLLPALSETDWKAAERLPALEELVGVDREQATVFVRDGKNNVFGLNLATRRVRLYSSGVETAAVGADGTLYVVDSGGAVRQFTRRAPERYRAEFETVPEVLHGMLGGRVFGTPRDGRLLITLATNDDSARSVPIASGETAATPWGDLFAVAADTALIVYDPAGRRDSRSVRLGGQADAIAFSPSGHQLYAALNVGRLAVLDRFGLRVLRHIDLPGRARELRPGPFGRWLIARPETGDSIWLVDLERERFGGAIASAWGADLPQLTSANALTVRRGDDVLAFDLAVDGFPETGRIEGAAADLWAAPGWSPAAAAGTSGRDRATGAASDGEEPGADSASAADRVYLQVSSSQNPTWANELAAKLTGAGLPASTIQPARQGDPYRVVLGPYRSREQAEESGRSLGMPFFVVSGAEIGAP